MAMKHTPNFSLNNTFNSNIAPPKYDAVKLSPLQVADKKSEKGSSKSNFLSVKGSPVTKSVLADLPPTSDLVHRAEAKILQRLQTNLTVNDGKSTIISTTPVPTSSTGTFDTNDFLEHKADTLVHAKPKILTKQKAADTDKILEQEVTTVVRAKPKGHTKQDFLAKIRSRKSAPAAQCGPIGSSNTMYKHCAPSAPPLEPSSAMSYEHCAPSAPPSEPAASNNETGASARKNDTTLTLVPGNEISDRTQDWMRAKITIENFAESSFFVSLMTVLTIWALYNSDIKFAATDKEADLAFEVIISIAFFLFILEIAMSCVYKPDYWWLPDWKPLEDEAWYQTWIRRCQVGSFYFWLDWLATLSLILEMTWILEDGSSAVNGGDAQTAAGGGAQVGVRAGRVVRLARMVRLVRLVKLLKYFSLKNPFELKTVKNETSATDAAPAESRVGAAMSDLTNRRVIVLILLMLIVIPQLTVNDIDFSFPLGVQFVHHLGKLNASDSATYSTGLNLVIQTVQDELPLLYMNLNGHIVYHNAVRYDSLRDSERATFTLSDDNFYTSVSYDQKVVSIQSALFSIYTTSFIIVLLMGGVYFFLSDVNRLVIGPIERLVDLVRKISANPLGVEYKMLGAEEGFLEGLETTVLLTTITKIGALMRVGFGEAGASVIARNLAESSGGRLNLMGAGTMIRSIFGFCDVRQFTDATECLQEEVMLFVNRIAHILHSIVVQCSGAANKNIGDAFLLTWKLDEKLTVAQVASLADQALLAFMKSLIELSRYQEFIVNFSLAATARLYKRFPDYNVRIGSGLHVGWAIEGAIGSHRKIDASYLSPHVNNTEYLESSTKKYGVPLLLSEPFFRLLSPAAAKYCRQVDRIRRSEFEEPMGLYAYDADLDIDWNDLRRHLSGGVANRLKLKANKARTNVKMNLQESLPAGNKVPHRPVAISASDPKMLSRSRRGSAISRLVGLAPSAPMEEPLSDERKQELADLEARAQRAKQTPTVVIPKYTEAIWTTDQDLIDQRHKVNDSFRAVWENGINAYLRGDWQRARDVLERTWKLSKNTDGPSHFLIEMIDEHGGTAPQNWPGYREDY